MTNYTHKGQEEIKTAYTSIISETHCSRKKNTNKQKNFLRNIFEVGPDAGQWLREISMGRDKVGHVN